MRGKVNGGRKQKNSLERLILILLSYSYNGFWLGTVRGRGGETGGKVLGVRKQGT